MYKTFIRFFTIADYEEEELWLREQHKAGWKLDKVVPPCFYRFESCGPEDTVYRLDYKNSEQTAEYMQLVRDYGWELCGNCLGWLYFRKSADSFESEGDSELFSDNFSKAEMAGRIAKTRLLPLAVIFLCCVVPNLLRYLNGTGRPLGTIFLWFFGIMFVVYVFLLTYCGIKLKKIRDRYRN